MTLSKIYGHNLSNYYVKRSSQELKPSPLSNCLMSACKKLTCLKHAQCPLTCFKYILFPTQSHWGIPSPSTILLTTWDCHSRPKLLAQLQSRTAPITSLNGLKLGNLSLHNQGCSIHPWTSVGTKNAFSTSSQLLCMPRKCMRPPK